MHTTENKKSDGSPEITNVASIHKNFKIDSDDHGHIDYKDKEYTVIPGIGFTAKYTITAPTSGVWNGTVSIGDKKYPIVNNEPNHEYQIKGKTAGINTTIHVVVDWSEKKKTTMLVSITV